MKGRSILQNVERPMTRKFCDLGQETHKFKVIILNPHETGRTELELDPLSVSTNQ